ncbi:MAG: hypothetical protein ACQGVK_25955 [Myxococcota bacterium]
MHRTRASVRPGPGPEDPSVKRSAAAASLCLLALVTMAPSCMLNSQWVFPADGAVVDVYEFDAVMQVVPLGLDLGAMEVTLNGEPVPFAAGADDTFTVHVEPGAPLRDDNVLYARIPLSSASAVSIHVVSSFRYEPPGKARAFVLEDPSDLIEGPLAHNQLGDVMLANDRARFVVQRANVRDLHSVGQFGGNLIDAEHLSQPGNDNFFEMTPSVNVETVINATRVSILNDGQDGTAAIVESCGPDDLIDYINASSQVEDFGVVLPPGIDDQDYDVEGCTRFVLEPRRGDAPGNSVEVTTTIINTGADPIELYPGDYLNGMGELEQFTRLDPASGGVFDAGIGEVTALAGLSSFAYFGFGDAQGTSYGRIGLPVESTNSPDSSFSTSGVSFVLAANSVTGLLLPGPDPATLALDPGESGSFGRIFVVGQGSAAEIVDEELDSTGTPFGHVEGCVTVGGAPAAGARVSAGPTDGALITDLVTTWVTDPGGCFGGRLPPGSWGIAAAREGTPYEGGGSTPQVHEITVVEGETVVQDMALPATGRLRVEVRDALDRPVPARISVVGFDPSPEPVIVYDFFGFFVDSTGTFNDISKDPLPFGIAAAKYTGADGAVEFDLEPGSFQVFVSRGTEYSAFDTPVVIQSGETTAVEAQIARVIDSTGFISSDFHVHSINSPDSRISLFNRVNQLSGEGIENFVATDHDARTDALPTIAAEGLGDWLTTTTGEEITTFDTGHYNAYPLGVDPARPSGGSTDWARPAPPGEDFPSKGAFIRAPAEIHEEVLNQLDSQGRPLNTSPNVAVQINHIDSHFSPLKIDTSVEPPSSFLAAGEPEIFRLDPSVSNFFHAFPALELWNGSSRGAQAAFLDERIGIWMNLLNQAIPTTFVADTDTHTFLTLRTAGARTWTASPTDAPGEIDPDDVGAAILAGRATGGQGLYVQTRLREADAPANEANLRLGGSTTLKTAGDGEVELVIDIQAPVWAEFDRVDIYVNARTVVSGSNDGVPVLFGAEPTRSLIAGIDFAIPAPVQVVEGIPGAERRELTLTEAFSLGEDSWFVVVVKGTPDVSRPMYPVFAGNLRRSSNGSLDDLLDGNLGEAGVMALGATNALWADVDGTDGFAAPGVRLAP